ncbi:hypothetical protein MTP99_005119 [Tenebrio molitor]|nr:hypothetical protein MTP99_005119 [Tenebrio molitor]CAH1381147.1 unnamed protein product [Tenebrio molitor]
MIKIILTFLALSFVVFAEKPGSCPVSLTKPAINIPCTVPQCSSDDDCLGPLKCCSNICGSPVCIPAIGIPSIPTGYQQE